MNSKTKNRKKWCIHVLAKSAEEKITNDNPKTEKSKQTFPGLLSTSGKLETFFSSKKHSAQKTRSKYAIKTKDSRKTSKSDSKNLVVSHRKKALLLFQWFRAQNHTTMEAHLASERKPRASVESVLAGRAPKGFAQAIPVHHIFLRIFLRFDPIF